MRASALKGASSLNQPAVGAVQTVSQSLTLMRSWCLACGVAQHRQRACGSRQILLGCRVTWLACSHICTPSRAKCTCHCLVTDIWHRPLPAAEQLSSCVAQLSGYFDRYKARLNPANAAQLQQLSRLASLFLDCLRQHSSGPGSTVQQATPAAPSSTAAGAAPGCRVLTCSRFLIELSIDNINLFPLLEWLRESKVLFKVSGYAASAAQAAGSVQLQRPAPQAAAGAAAEAPEAEARESLPSLHAFVGFLQALTNTNTDGRVIIDCQAQQAPSKQVAASTAAGTGTGTTSEAATRPGSNSSTRSSVRAAPQAQLRFVLLNAAGHFSKILQGARSVVLASGTLAPVEALRAQLFPAVPDKGIRHFECGHVIDADNLVALAVGKGPSGAVLDFR